MNQLKLCSRCRAVATHPASFSRAWTQCVGDREPSVAFVAWAERGAPASDDLLVGPARTAYSGSSRTSTMEMVIHHRELLMGDRENASKFLQSIVDPKFAVTGTLAKQKRPANATGDAVVPARRNGWIDEDAGEPWSWSKTLGGRSGYVVSSRLVFVRPSKLPTRQDRRQDYTACPLHLSFTFTFPCLSFTLLFDWLDRLYEVLDSELRGRKLVDALEWNHIGNRIFVPVVMTTNPFTFPPNYLYLPVCEGSEAFW